MCVNRYFIHKSDENNCCYLIVKSRFRLESILVKGWKWERSDFLSKCSVWNWIRRRILKGKSKISFLLVFYWNEQVRDLWYFSLFLIDMSHQKHQKSFFYAIRYIQRWNVHILVINILESWWTCANMVFS